MIIIMMMMMIMIIINETLRITLPKRPEGKNIMKNIKSWIEKSEMLVRKQRKNGSMINVINVKKATS